jgi:anti-repressor protein
MDGVTIRDSMDRNQKPVLINESVMYSLILGSKLPSAKRFKRWVTSEVLPSIRKTGTYSVNNETVKMLEALNKKIDAIEQKLSTGRESVQTSQVAYMLQSKGVDIGRNNFIKFLRDNGYMIRDEDNKNIASKRSLDEGLMELKEKEVKVRGVNFMHVQTFITPRVRIIS